MQFSSWQTHGVKVRKGVFLIQQMEYQCQDVLCQSIFPWRVKFCPFCGTKQTNIIVRAISPSPKKEPILPKQVDTSRLERMVVPMSDESEQKKNSPFATSVSDDQQKKFDQYVAENISNSYCDSRFFGILFAHGKQTLGLDERRVQSMLTLTLERLNVVNEKALLDELDNFLQTMTGTEKKLSSKGRTDALQHVCKPRPGKAKGLDPGVAELFITNFCRQNGVREKSGFWGWKIL